MLSMLMRSVSAACAAFMMLLVVASAAAAQTAVSSAESAYQRKDYATALSLGRQACEGGKPDSCVVVAAVLLNGLGVPADVTGARAVLERGCGQGSGASCLNLGYTWMRKDGTDYVQARRWLEKACTLGNADGCANLGVAQARGLGGAPDRLTGVTTLQRACELNSRSGCASLGVLQADAKAPGGANLPAAAKALLKACDLGETSACGSAGMLLLAGPGVTPDPAASFRALGLACGSGAEEACRNLRSFQSKFPASSATPAAYQTVYEKACRSPKSVYCLEAALAAAEVAGTPGAFSAAAELAGKACKPSKPGPKACRARDLMQAISQDLRACKEGSTPACGRMSVGVVRLVDEFEDLNPLRAISLAAHYAPTACNAGDLEGCAAVPWVWYFDNSKAPIDTVAPVAGRACAGKVALGCEFIGWFTLLRFDEQLNFVQDQNDYYRDTDADWRRLAQAWEDARPSLAMGCAAGWAEGCIALVLRQPMMEPGRPPADDAVRAACNLTWASRCYEIASTLLGAQFQRGKYDATLKGKLGCAVDEAVCRAVGRWYAGQMGSSPNQAYGKSTQVRLGLAMMDEACTRGSADACVFMGLYHTPSDQGALAERQPNWTLAAVYARKILALDPANLYGKDLAKRAAERGL